MPPINRHNGLLTARQSCLHTVRCGIGGRRCSCSRECWPLPRSRSPQPARHWPSSNSYCGGGLPERGGDATLLRRSARFDPDPLRRRQARVILAAQPQTSAGRRRWLLRAQAWNPTASEQLLVPVVLKAQAYAARQLGLEEEAQSRWQELLERHPLAPPRLMRLMPGPQWRAQNPAAAATIPGPSRCPCSSGGRHRQRGGALGGCIWPDGVSAGQVQKPLCWRPATRTRRAQSQPARQVGRALAQQGSPDGAVAALAILLPRRAHTATVRGGKRNSAEPSAADLGGDPQSAAQATVEWGCRLEQQLQNLPAPPMLGAGSGGAGGTNAGRYGHGPGTLARAFRAASLRLLRLASQ